MATFSRRSNRSPVVIPALLLTALVGACSSGSDDDTEMPAADGQVDEVLPGLVVGGLNGAPAEDLVSPWLGIFRLFQDTTFPNGSAATANLRRFDDGFILADVIEFYTPELDTCEIRDLNAAGAGDDGDDNSSNPSISGGLSVTINTGSGPWLEMGRPDLDSPGFYSEFVGELGVLPADATLSIPGDGFPNVPAYPLLDQPLAPVRLSPAPGILTAEDIVAPFTWEPMPDRPGGFFQIAGLAFNAAGEFQGFPVVCDVVDDGEFTLPQSVIDGFAGSDLVFEARFERLVTRLDLSDGVVFYQAINVTE